MSIRRMATPLVGGMIIALSGLVAVPMAAASTVGTLWVAHATTTPADNSCAHPGYNTIASALTAASAREVINVCAGTYTEQLQITKSVSLVAVGAVTVALPAVVANATTACDTAPGTGSYSPDQDGISICGGVTVNMTGLTVHAAWPPSTCYDSEYGILVAGGALLNFTDSHLTAAGVVDNGCQGGVGIQVGMAWTTPVEVGTAVIRSSTVAGYQKNGITCDGLHSKCSVLNSAVTGSGFHTSNAQNGIQVSNGASGTIAHSTVANNECSTVINATCGSQGYQAAGILFYDAAPRGSSLTDSTIENNDYGVYYLAGAPAPTGSGLLIQGDSFKNQNYSAMLLDQGWTTVNGDTVTNNTNDHPAACNAPGTTVPGNTAYTSVCGYHTTQGIVVYQYNGQAFSAKAYGTNDTISNQYAAVQISSDRNAGDQHVTAAINLNPASTNNTHALVNNALPGSYTT